jgi:hypothetical protein
MERDLPSPKKEERKMRYQGLVKNRITGEVRKTRLYSTYKEAHYRAESLGTRVYGRNDNWEIDVVINEKEAEQV